MIDFIFEKLSFYITNDKERLLKGYKMETRKATLQECLLWDLLKAVCQYMHKKGEL